MSTSKDIEQKLQSARVELEKKEKQLLESKEALIQKLEDIFPGYVDSAMERVVSGNASRIGELTPEQLRDMKKELEREKPKAIENTFKGMRASQDWLWCQTGGTSYSTDPISILGIREEGPIWGLVRSYDGPIVAVFKRYGLDEAIPPGSKYPMFPLKPHYRFLEEKAKELNEMVGQAHKEYCSAKIQVKTLEQALAETRALEKFKSA